MDLTGMVKWKDWRYRKQRSRWPPRTLTQLEPKLSHVSCLLTAVFIDNTNTFTDREYPLSILLIWQFTWLCGSQHLCIINRRTTYRSWHRSVKKKQEHISWRILGKLQTPSETWQIEHIHFFQLPLKTQLKRDSRNKTGLYLRGQGKWDRSQKRTRNAKKYFGRWKTCRWGIIGT